MNRKRVFKLLLAVITLASVFLACESEDRTAPNIEEPTINFQSENISVEAPSELRFDGLFSDDDGVDSLALTIIPVTTLSVEGRATNRKPFFYAEKTDIGGQRSAITKLITLPDSAAEGDYILNVGFQDNSGNVADSLNLPFQLTNVGPLLELVVNADTAWLVNSSDSTIQVQGQVVYVNTELASLTLAIEGKANQTIQQLSRADSTLFSNSINFDFPYTFPEPLDTGNYVFRISAVDTVNNATVLETPFIVR